ncbi:MAG TPA: S24 family peptidase [Burkholderiales bacterium]|nr:S24 family peptidase [Burkholderiales bacterium]
MTIEELRRLNINLIIEKHKNLRTFCLESGIDYSNLYQVIKGNRTFGEILARKIEEKTNLPHGYLDKNHNENDTLEPDTFRIPEYNVKLSAGLGEEVIHPENIKRYHTFNEEFLTDFRVKKNNLAIVQVVGDSMHPTLLSNELVVIDFSQKDPLDNHVYAITTQNQTWVKRYRITPAGGKWQSDNEEYREFDKPLNDGTPVIPVGLVLFSLGRKIN